MRVLAELYKITILQLIQYLEKCSVINVRIGLLKSSEKAGFLGRMETQGNGDDCLEKYKREEKGKIKS